MHSLLSHQNESVARAIQALAPETVLSTPVADLVESLFERLKIEPVVLDIDGRVSSGAEDVEVSVSGWSDEHVRVPGTRVEVLIPFEGDIVLFDVRPSTSDLNPPRFELRGKTFVVRHEGPSPIDQNQAKSAIEHLITRVAQHLEWQRRDIEPWNERLRRDLPQQIEVRREKILHDRQLDAFLEVPVVGRSNPTPVFIVDPPKAPRPVLIATTISSPAFAPEPAISDEGFAAILAEIESVTTAVQRLPKTFTAMPEESLRDVLLVILNNRFGPASGETFSRKGKTDIFIPYGGDERAVFIAECKWWTGPKAFRDAIDQLLGYLTWRDSRASLIVFVKSGNPSAIGEKATAEVQKHGSFKRMKETTKRPTFTLANPTDTTREVHLALLVVAVVA